MKTYPVIAICGAIGAGKSSVGKILDANHMYERSALAGPLKDMLQALGVPTWALYGTPEEKAKPLAQFGGKCGRELMQTLGDWGRAQDEAFWLRIWKNDAPEISVVDDARYPNEFSFVRSLGGVVILVKRPNTTNLVGISGHASEQHWMNERHDAVIENSGDLYQLEEEVLRVLRKLSGVEGRHVVSGAQA